VKHSNLLDHSLETLVQYGSNALPLPVEATVYGTKDTLLHKDNHETTLVVWWWAILLLLTGLGYAPSHVGDDLVVGAELPKFTNLALEVTLLVFA
jgi:hypothetical protein